MKLKGAEIVIEALKRHGIKIIAGIPGGSNLPIYDALAGSGIRHVLARHEQGAGFIAQGMARSTGKTAVCMATSGPGVTNLITAIADAKLDSIPLVAITGQVATSMIGTDAFQEVDTFGMTTNITKHNYLVDNAMRLPSIIDEAFHIAESGRPGPVLIDIPKDVQLQTVDMDWCIEKSGFGGPVEIDTRRVSNIARMIEKAKKPVIYAGGGIVSSGASDLLRTFANMSGIPVALTLMGLDAFPHDDPLFLGMLGMHGAPYTNRLLDETDLIIALGVRFDDRAVGRVDEFCPKASTIHIDIDASEIDKIKKSDISLVADIKDALKLIIPQLEPRDRVSWMKRIALLKAKHDPSSGCSADNPLNPVNFIRYLRGIAGDDAIITTDVGQHQMWVAQHYPFKRPRTFLTSGGLGTMGFGLPVAIGAALANPEKRVVCISGDGSIQMNIQEMATLAELNLNVAVIVMNNQHLGLVRQQQELFFGGNYIASRFPFKLDFAAIGGQFGIRGINLAGTDNPIEETERIMMEKGPCIIDVPIHFSENVFPMVPPGAANRDMITRPGSKKHKKAPVSLRGCP